MAEWWEFEKNPSGDEMRRRVAQLRAIDTPALVCRFRKRRSSPPIPFVLPTVMIIVVASGEGGPGWRGFVRRRLTFLFLSAQRCRLKNSLGVAEAKWLSFYV